MVGSSQSSSCGMGADVLPEFIAQRRENAVLANAPPCCLALQALFFGGCSGEKLFASHSAGSGKHEQHFGKYPTLRVKPIDKTFKIWGQDSFRY